VSSWKQKIIAKQPAKTGDGDSRIFSRTLVFALFYFGGIESAAAQTTAIYGGNPDHIALTLFVTASVSGGCGFSSAPAGTFDAQNIAAGFAHDFDFAATCNVPFRVAVVSMNGGLLAPVPPAAGYTALAPYDVSLVLVGDPGVNPASAVCSAASLALAAPSPCAFRGPVSATIGLLSNGKSSGAVGSHVRVSAPPYAGVPLLAASPLYRDVLTITISASP
jgi:hypothetical protein